MTPFPPPATTLVQCRWTAGVCCEVAIGGDRVFKRYLVPHGVRPRSASWQLEHAALAHLGGAGGAPLSAGVREERVDQGRVFLLEKTFVPGSPLSPGETVDLGALASLLATFHARGVVVDDVSAKNIVLAADRSPRCVDFGRARCFRPGSWRLLHAVGREFTKLLRECLDGDRARWRTFLRTYFVRTGLSWPAQLAVLGGTSVAAWVGPRPCNRDARTAPSSPMCGPAP